MPHRLKTGVEFVRRAPTSDSARLLPVRVARMTMAHARWWDGTIQPTIDREGGRADCGWNWPLIHAATTSFATVLQQDPGGFVIGVELPDDGFLPCVMIKLVQRFRDLKLPRRNAVFLWYMSDAPKSALVESKLIQQSDHPKRLGSFGLDVAVTVAINRWQGRLGLHASPEGGTRLMDWYSARGMQQLPAKSGRHGLRINDGRYFYYDTEGALGASQSLDVFR